MKQLLQSVSTGRPMVTELPCPIPGPNEILVRVNASAVSAGTEKAAVVFAEKSVLQKALARPDLVRQVVDKARREGILATVETVRNRLDTDLALGYSNAGVVIAVGEAVTGFTVGDRVACAGGGYASHAEIVRIPQNLAAVIPIGKHDMSFEEAAFATVGAIAMQGVRLAQLQLGETVAVIGLGLIGLIAVQLAKAAGCRVVGMDVNAERCRLAQKLGCDATADDEQAMQLAVAAATEGYGADAVVITAATPSDGPVTLAGDIARHRGRVVAVGAVGLGLPRKPYYDKELSFQISCSYGPGRYDPDYEEKGHDYPYGFVRWTEGRNVGAVLQSIAEGKLNVRSLISHRFPISEGEKAYELISGKTREPFLGVVLNYPEEPSMARRIDLNVRNSVSAPRVCEVRIGLVGAGNFATGVLLPAIKRAGRIGLVGVCAATGVSAHATGSRLGFRFCTTDFDELLNDPAINTIVIATRHHLHARQVIAALKAGKHVFCEKPLCLSQGELAEVVAAYEQMHDAGLSNQLLVGFNRRFASMAIELKDFISRVREPLMMHYRINAGYIPRSHWIQDADQGGGRIIGEACHFVDFLTFLASARVKSVRVAALPDNGRYCEDNFVATLTYDNGSVGVITYVANGDKSVPKERIEVFGGGCAGVLHDFRRLELIRNGRTRTTRSWLRQDKGHSGEWRAFGKALAAGALCPIPFSDIVNTTETSMAILNAVRTREIQQIGVATGEFMHADDQC